MARLDNYVKRWRAALHVTVSALTFATVATLGLAAIPVATATLTVQHAWQDGFIARFIVTNASMTTLPGWRIDFDMPAGQGVSHAWNSTVTQSGTHFVVTPANWNRTLAPGATANGGFRGVLTGSYSPPVNCVINGQYPCT
jgi:Cellulose binding domain